MHISRMENPGSWLARFGAAGFVFFLAKGLLWLAVGVIAALASVVRHN